MLGVRDDVGNLFQSHRHACWTHASDKHFGSTIASFLEGGLAKRERIAYAAPDGQHMRAFEFLADAGIDAHGLERSGALLVIPAEEAYMRGGVFDPDARVHEYSAMVDSAIDDGFSGLRVAAEAGWITADPKAAASWPAYELRADLLAATKPFTALCCFDERTADPEVLRATTSLHGASHSRSHAPVPYRLYARDATTVALSGDVDFSSAPNVHSALATALCRSPIRTIDLSELSFMDVGGMRALAAALQAAAACGPMPRVVSVPPAVRRVWGLLGLDEGVTTLD